MKAKMINSNFYLKNNSYFFTSFSFKEKPIKESELIEFFQSVCEFFNIYENVVMCLESSLHTISNEKNKLILVINNVKKGQLLSKALENSGIISNTIVNIIKAGEKNNELCGSFNLIVDFLKNKQDQKNRLIKSIFYPLFTLGVFFITIILFSKYIIPSLIELILELNANCLNNILLVKTILWIMEKLLFLMFLSGFMLYMTYLYAYDWFEKICTKIPLIKTLFIYNNLFLFSYYMQISLKNSLSIEESLDVAISSSSNFFKKIFKSVKQELLKGNEFSLCLKKNMLIPKIFIDIIETGEKTNNLTRSFEISSRFFKNQYDQLIDSLVSYLPILLISLISVFLIIFVWFLLFPLYSLGV